MKNKKKIEKLERKLKKSKQDATWYRIAAQRLFDILKDSTYAAENDTGAEIAGLRNEIERLGEINAQDEATKESMRREVQGLKNLVAELRTKLQQLRTKRLQRDEHEEG